MRRLSVSALCKLSSLTIKWISLDHALFFFVLGKRNSSGQDEMRNSTWLVASLTQMLQPNFRRSVVMLCATPNFSTNAYIERMYENPVKIQLIVWLRLWNTFYPIVTRSILRGTWKGIVCCASSEMVKGYTMFFLLIVAQIDQCFFFQACFSLWYSLNYLQDKGKLYDTSHLHLLTNWPKRTEMHHKCACLDRRLFFILRCLNIAIVLVCCLIISVYHA